jgi:hypothetical protein
MSIPYLWGEVCLLVSLLSWEPSSIVLMVRSLSDACPVWVCVCVCTYCIDGSLNVFRMPCMCVYTHTHTHQHTHNTQLTPSGMAPGASSLPVGKRHGGWSLSAALTGVSQRVGWPVIIRCNRCPQAAINRASLMFYTDTYICLNAVRWTLNPRYHEKDRAMFI